MNKIKDQKIIAIIMFAIVTVFIKLTLVNNNLLKAAIIIGILICTASAIYCAYMLFSLSKLKKEYKERIKKTMKAKDRYDRERKSYEDMWDEEFNNWQSKESDNLDCKTHLAFGLFEINNAVEINKDDLKKKYKQLMKTAHPDNGGCDEYSKLITSSYNLLLEYC